MPPTASTAEIAPRVRAFLQRHVGSRVLADEDDIFARGFVNSLMAVQLVAFVEKEFGITIGDDDLKLENFSSVNRITSFVTAKLG